MTVEEERTSAYGADRDGVTLPAFVPAPAFLRKGRPRLSLWG